MSTLARERPDPIPAIHPVWEYQVSGALKDRYEDMKATLQVPWMGVVTMAFAHYRTFFDTLWAGTRELCASRPYVEGAQELRRGVEAGVADLSPPPIAARLHELGYAERELDDIRNMLEIFSHGNHLYFPLCLSARLLLEGGELSAEHTVPPPYPGRHAPTVRVPFVFMEPHHALDDLRAVYEDVKATLRLPFVNSDYRALSRWPSYFALAWRDLRPLVGTAAHEAVARAYHERALALCRALPNPGRLTGVGLRASAAADARPGEVLQVTRLFTYLIPGLMVNVAFFRHQLQAG